MIKNLGFDKLCDILSEKFSKFPQKRKIVRRPFERTIQNEAKLKALNECNEENNISCFTRQHSLNQDSMFVHTRVVEPNRVQFYIFWCELFVEFNTRSTHTFIVLLFVWVSSVVYRTRENKIFYCWYFTNSYAFISIIIRERETWNNIFMRSYYTWWVVNCAQFAVHTHTNSSNSWLRSSCTQSVIFVVLNVFVERLSGQQNNNINAT